MGLTEDPSPSSLQLRRDPQYFSKVLEGIVVARRDPQCEPDVACCNRDDQRCLPEPQDCDKKLTNSFGFRAQFERFAENKHYFRDSSKNRKNQGAVESAKSAL